MNYFLEYILYFFLLLVVTHITAKILKIKPSNHKYGSLDGLRGVCSALIVIFHTYWRGGGADISFWNIYYIGSQDVMHYILLTGDLSVGMFFILSGFLFFKKAMADSFDFKCYAISRVLRIYPPVIASILLVYIASIIIDNFSSFRFDGVLEAIPSFFDAPSPDINGTSFALFNSGVFWSLIWELRLYAVIPCIYLFLKWVNYPRVFILAAMGVVSYLWYYNVCQGDNLSFIMYFLVGFFLATVKFESKITNVIGVVVLVLAIAATHKTDVMFNSLQSYNMATPFYMAIVFYTIKCGCDYFGFLQSAPIKMLGTCSFSLYLTHGVPQIISKQYFFNYGDHVWKIIAIVFAGILSPVMYKVFERPFLWGEKQRLDR